MVGQGKLQEGRGDTGWAACFYTGPSNHEFAVFFNAFLLLILQNFSVSHFGLSESILADAKE